MDINFTSFFWIFVYMKGSFIWYTQRYTSLIVLSYLIYILSFIFTNQDINFFSWSDFFLSFQVRFLSSIVFLVIVLHAFIGLWTVGTDYLTKRTLGFLNVSLSRRADTLRYIYYLIFGLLGIVYLTAIFYIIWL
jgi:succinate dehydrogenase / fumarate reductase membrane anchor subunit